MRPVNPHIHRDPSQPCFHGHVVSPTVAIVDMIKVPEDRRRQGIGGDLYRSWENSLPDEVTFIHLWAMAAAIPFWERMGFIVDFGHVTQSGSTGMSKSLDRA